MINIDSRLVQEVPAPGPFRLLCYLGSMMNEQRLCYPGNKKMCRDLDISLPTLQSWKKFLTDNGLIEVKTRLKENSPGQTSNYYLIKTPLVSNYTPTKKLSTGDVKEVTTPPIKYFDKGDMKEIDRAPTKEVGNEVLVNEVLTNEVLVNEQLKREREQFFFVRSINNISKIIFEFLYPHMNKNISMKYSFDIDDEKELETIEDPTIKLLFKKIRRAAKSLHSSYASLKMTIPKWRIYSHSWCNDEDDDTKPNAEKDAVDQVECYAEWCRVTKTYLVKDPDKIAETILRDDWCAKMKEYADERFPYDYDPMDNFDAAPNCIMWYFYEEQMVYVDKKNKSRIF